MKYSGYLPSSLEFGYDDLMKGRGYVKSQRSRVYSEARDDKYKDYYYATAPGQYGVTIDFVTRTGEVFRYRLDLTVKQNHIYTEPKRERTYYINDSIGFNIDSWHAGAVVSVHITEGSLPPGIILANSWDKPFGFYGKPTVVGDYTVKFRIANYSDYYDYTYTFHIKPAFVKIKGNAKNVGDTLELEIGDVPYSPYSILWQASTDKEKWKTITSLGVDDTYTTKPDDAKKYIRASICRMASGLIKEQHFSDARYINPLPELSGTVFYTSGIASNMKITTARGGLLNDLYNKDPEKLHYQWQVKNNKASDWKDLDAETKLTYTPTDEMIGTQIRVKATYDGYSGAVYSTPREIHKRVNNGTPVTPSVYTEDPYTHVTVTNAKVDQEYVVMYATGTPDWTNAKHTDKDGKLTLECEKDRTVFIYTRMRETDTYQSGMKTAYKVVYNGHTEYLQGLTFDKTSITTKVGDVTQLTVSPLPADFGKWDDSYTLSWFVNGSEVELYEDEDCTTPVTQHSMTSHKTVYVKGKTATSNVSVGVERTVGYNDLKIAFCSVTVADEDGDFVLQSLNFDDVTVIPGEVTSANYTTYPTPAKVGLLSFEKGSGPESEITIFKSGKNDGTVNIVVPDDALPGTYYYGAKVDNKNTPILSSIKITVQPDKFNVVLDPDDGSGKTITKTVRNGAEYYLPDCPESFNVPEGYDFDGWDKGAVGSSVVVTEDITLKAQWKKHEHTLVYAARVEPTCTDPGIEEHYYCIMCGKLFEDAEGTIEVPNADRFELPPKGHTPGKAVKENVIEADCTHEGSYDEVVYCADCETKLSREAKTTPANGHTLEAVPEKAATCTEEGHSAYYRCTECGKFFIDEGAATELTDTLDTAVAALGHDWGESEYTWADDNSTVTAKRVCKNDPTHVETETAKTKREENDSQTILTAEFDNPAFRIQKKTAKLETDLDTDSKTDSDTDGKIGSDTDSKKDSDTDTKTNSDTESKTDSDTDSKNDSDTDSKTDSDTDSDAKSDTEKPKPNGIYGDLDGDGNITAGDALIILRTSVGLETLTSEQISLADVDSDSVVTAQDALAVLRNSVGILDDNLVGKPITA